MIFNNLITNQTIMANFNDLRLDEMINSGDPIIKRCARSIKMQLQKLEDEFYQLRDDDPDFEISYEKTDLFDWMIEQEIIGDNALNSR